MAKTTGENERDEPRAKDKPKEGAIDKYKLILALLFLAGAGLIAGSQHKELDHTLIGEIIRDLGIALCISVFLAIIIEISLARKTFLAGLDAIMYRTVPKSVWQEFRQHVIIQPMMRENWSLEMGLEEQGDKDSKYYISKSAIEYTVVALVDKLDAMLLHEFDAHRDLPNNERRIIEAVIPSGTFNYDQLHQANFLTPPRMVSLPIKLSKHEEKSKPIKVVFREKILCPDIIAWWMTKVTEGVTIRIKTPTSCSATVLTFHPDASRLTGPKSVGDHQEWAFDGVMFPGQGFEIRLFRN